MSRDASPNVPRKKAVGKLPARPWAERARRELVCRDRDPKNAVAQGDRSWFRPGQLILDIGTARRYDDQLHRVDEDRGFGGRGDARVDLVQVFLDPGTDVVELAAWIRQDAARGGDGQRVVVGPNYCWRGEPMYHGGPGGEPRPAKARRLATSAGRSQGCDIATLDTGVVDGLPAELTSCLVQDADDVDKLDVDGNGVLDSQNGHGSFVAGVVHQVAPELRVDPGRVLDSTGLGDDATVTRELLETSAAVVNLSLGGYTEDDRAPVAMAEVVRMLTRSRVVVAAAGNNSSDRPFWPAAFKGVVAVAAYDSTGGAPRPAAFSNFGSWVDVCAPGVGLVSTFATFPTGAPKPQFRGWAQWDGTSFAAPQVAALIAQLVSKKMSPREAAVRLLDEHCRFDPALAQYGLVYEPPTSLL